MIKVQLVYQNYKCMNQSNPHGAHRPGKMAAAALHTCQQAIIVFILSSPDWTFTPLWCPVYPSYNT